MRDGGRKREKEEKRWKRETRGTGFSRSFVEDGGREAKKERYFRSHDTTGPADHFALFLFSARRPDLSTPPSSSSSSSSPSFRLTRGVANRSRTRETDGLLLFDFRRLRRNSL